MRSQLLRPTFSIPSLLVLFVVDFDVVVVVAVALSYVSKRAVPVWLEMAA